jgi:hypothetical protein
VLVRSLNFSDVLQVEQLLERIDLNSDKKIVFDEFAAALIDWKQVRSKVPGQGARYWVLHATPRTGNNLACTR